MRVTIISGSARKQNNTLRVAKALAALLEPNHKVKIIDFVNYDIPLLAQGGLNLNELTDFQNDLLNSIGEAHIVITISPEYNWSTTPEILNMMHLLPTKQMPGLMHNKIFAFVGVSTGKGGKAPALHLMQVLNKLISFSNFQSVVSAKIFESHYTKEVLDEDGRFLGNEMYKAGMLDFCNYTIKIAERWFR